jgi:hypothetical protein
VFHLLQLLDGLKNHLNFSDSRAPQTKGDMDLAASQLLRPAPKPAKRDATEAPGSGTSRKVLRSSSAKKALNRDRLFALLR